MVIEIGSERGHAPDPSSSDEFLSIVPSPTPRKHLEAASSAKVSRKKGKKLSHVTSMGDEWIDNRRRDVVQPIRRSFSMDSAADSQLYLAVQEIIQRHSHVNNELLNHNEDSSSSTSRVKKSFFSFGQGRCSRNAVQSVALEPRG